MAARPKGAVVYEGPSAITGAMIAAVITGLARPSRNGKTGPMAQLFIFRQDMHPLEAIRTGLDDAICGDCKLRGVLGKKRPCYVEVGKAPSKVWHAWARGSYPVLTLGELAEALLNAQVRFGAYGEPVAAPLPIVSGIARLATDWSGYTHRWPWLTGKVRERWQGLVMASVDTVAEQIEAQRQGWRTFRGKHRGSPRMPSEKPCPAGPKASQVQCFSCPIKCNGGTGPNVVIDVHGNGAGHFPQEV